MEGYQTLVFLPPLRATKSKCCCVTAILHYEQSKMDVTLIIWPKAHHLSDLWLYGLLLQSTSFNLSEKKTYNALSLSPLRSTLSTLIPLLQFHPKLLEQQGPILFFGSRLKTFGFDMKKINMRQEISISAFILRYLHLDLLQNLEDRIICNRTQNV